MAFGLGAIAETQYLTARLIVDTSGAAGPLKALNAQLAGMGTGWKSAGIALSGSVKFLERTTLAAVGAAAVLENQFIKVQDAQAAMARTLDGESVPAIALLNKQILDMSKTVPVAVTELYRIAEVIGTTGIAAESVDELTNVVAKLAATTDLSADEAGLAMARLLRIFGDVNDKGQIAAGAAEGLASGLVKASLGLASSDQDILKATLRFAALGQKMELTKGQIIALAAVSTGLGQQPEAVGGSIQRVLQIMLKYVAQTKEGKDGTLKFSAGLKQMADIAGVSAKTFYAAWQANPFEAIGKFLKGFGQLSAEQQATLFGSGGLFPSLVRGQQLFQNLGSQWESLTRSSMEFDAEIKRGQLLQEQFQVRTDTLAAKIQLLWNAFTRAGVAFGDTFDEALGGFIVKLTKAIDDAIPAVEAFGKAVGEWFEKFDWEAAIRTAERFFGIFKLGFDIVRQLPTELLGAIALFKTLQVLSGGAFGNLATTGIKVVFDQFFARGAPGNPMFVWVENQLGLPGGTVTKYGLLKFLGLAGIFAGFATGAITTGDTPTNTVVPRGDQDLALSRQQVEYLRTIDKHIAESVPGSPDWERWTRNREALLHGAPGPNAYGRTEADLARQIKTNQDLMVDYGRTEADLARQIAENTGGTELGIASLLKSMEKWIDSLRPEHRRGEVGRSRQTTEGRLLLKLPVESAKFDAALADLIKHYTDQPIGTKGHSRAFVLGNLNPIENRLGRELKQALKSGDGGRADDIVASLKALSKVPRNELPGWIRRLIRSVDVGNDRNDRNTKRTKSAVDNLADRTSGRLGEVKRAIAAKRLAVSYKGGPIRISPQRVSVGPTYVRATIGTRSIVRATQRTVAYGPGYTYEGTGTVSLYGDNPT